MTRLIPLTLLLLTACSSSGSGQQTQLMDEVERQISLPKGAQPLYAYTRYYASAPNGDVVAVYLLPDLQRRECKDEISSECPPLDGTKNLKAGERLWLDNSALLPKPASYGRAVVNVAFNPDAAQVTQASCSGAP